jgi:hypothetical protein
MFHFIQVISTHSQWRSNFVARKRLDWKICILTCLWYTSHPTCPPESWESDQTMANPAILVHYSAWVDDDKNLVSRGNNHEAEVLWTGNNKDNTGGWWHVKITVMCVCMWGGECPQGRSVTWSDWGAWATRIRALANRGSVLGSSRSVHGPHLLWWCWWQQHRCQK